MRILGASIFLLYFFAYAYGYENIVYRQYDINNISLKVLYIDLKNPRLEIKPYVSKKDESFQKSIHRQSPIAAINGTFFQDYRTFKPICNIMINKRLIYKGNHGTGLGITLSNNIYFSKVYNKKSKLDSMFTHFLACGPRLLHKKNVSVYPYAEGFSDLRLFQKKQRSAVGLTQDKRHLVLVTSSRTHLSALAKALQKLKISDAINLDGGSSSGMYFENKLLRKPFLSRASNLLMIFTQSEFWWQRWKHFMVES